MLKFWSKVINLGITDNLDKVHQNQVKMVNFGAVFITIASSAFFLQSLKVGNKVLSTALIVAPFYYLLVFAANYFYKTKLARSILFFGLCMQVGLFSLLDNPSSFTLNYYFGIAMLSFIVYNKTFSRVMGVLLCVLLYFTISYLQPSVQSVLPFDPVIYILDVVTLFAGIIACMIYFHKINMDYNNIILHQKIELEKININKTKLLSILTHDIRNPINSLNQLLEFQNDKVLSHEEINFIFEKIRKEFVSQFESIENLLDWSQNQLSEINVKIERTEVDQLIVNLIKELNYNINQKEINLGMSICGMDTINIDKTHLTIILRNLLINAIKFTKTKGHIYISTSIEKNKYRIDIEDDGMGFEGYSSTTFDELNEFTTQVGTNNEKGNGLGLTISKELAQKNNGKIYVKNGESYGTIVRLEFTIQ